jgi:hypothetical protein
MIFLSVTFFYDQLLVPNRRAKLDRIDQALLWIIKICLVVLFFTLPDLYNVAVSAQEEDASSAVPPQAFFFACSGGNLEAVQNALKEHPEWVHARTENGETPLHLT